MSKLRSLHKYFPPVKKKEMKKEWTALNAIESLEGQKMKDL